MVVEIFVLERFLLLLLAGFYWHLRRAVRLLVGMLVESLAQSCDVHRCRSSGDERPCVRFVVALGQLHFGRALIEVDDRSWRKAEQTMFKTVKDIRQLENKAAHEVPAWRPKAQRRGRR
jgi:hypothetical protein